MTPERLQEIRDLTRARWVPPDVVMELLSEVDRLEAVLEKVRGIAEGLRQAAKLDDARRLELIAQEQGGELLPVWDVHEKLIRVCRMDLAKTTADAVEAAFARPLDSPPATKGNP